MRNQTTIDKLENNQEYQLIIQDLMSNKTVQKMDTFRQHCNTSCLDHCLHVSYHSYLICKKYNLDYVSAARAGLLHDLFLYDWREKKQDGRTGLHAFTHPKTALKNSLKLFDLNEKEKDIIKKHMWPVTLPFPRYKESYIITFVDKYCALQETYLACKKSFNIKKLYRYAYVFLSMIAFRIL